MSNDKSNAAYPASRTDTLIGADMRVNGNITFKGVLRIQGSVTGNVSTDGISKEAIVTDTSGKLSGSIEAPHVVVRGHVSGPVRSSQTIQVQPGASLIGDVHYREIEIQSGGVVEGMLTPVAPVDNTRQGQACDGDDTNQVAATDTKTTRIAEYFRQRRFLATAMMLVVVLGSFAWFNRDMFGGRSKSVEVPSTTASAISGTVTPLANSAGEASSQDNRRDLKSDGTPPVESAGNVSVPDAPTQAAPTRRTEKDLGDVVTIQGANPAKSAAFLLVITKEPTVLVTKARLDQTREQRIAVPQGKRISIQVAEGQVFRVAEGASTEILYQGRKVGARTISSGAWMRFVPHGPEHD